MNEDFARKICKKLDEMPVSKMAEHRLLRAREIALRGKTSISLNGGSAIIHLSWQQIIMAAAIIVTALFSIPESGTSDSGMAFEETESESIFDWHDSVGFDVFGEDQ